ncbi:hypothetical protein [Klebsiella phage pKP-M212-2.1]|nr:hypothetical protein [Klebsiella phage pKP-M212-2.1]
MLASLNLLGVYLSHRKRYGLPGSSRFQSQLDK